MMLSTLVFVSLAGCGIAVVGIIGWRIGTALIYLANAVFAHDMCSCDDDEETHADDMGLYN